MGLPTWNSELRGSEGFLPLAGRSLLAEQCRWLSRYGIKQVLVAFAGEPDESPGPMPPGSLGDVKLEWLRRPGKMGTADCLRDAEEFIGSDPFVLLCPNLVPGDLDLTPLLSAPRREDTLIWTLVEPAAGPSEREVSLDGDRLRELPLLHYSRDRRRSALSTEVFRCEPQVLEHVPDSGYFDFREQLIPEVQGAGLQVRVMFSEGRATLVHDAADYLSALAESLYRRQPEPGETEIASGVWTRGDVEVSPSAVLVGPLLIDDGAVIHEAAQVVGPAYVGPGVRIGKGARVRQASLWSGSSVAEGAELTFSVLAEHQQVGPGETLGFAVRCGRDEPLGRPASLCRPSRPTAWGPERPVGESPFYPALKRLLDLLVAASGLLLSLPLWMLIAVAIRIDSSGPILYGQRRCGRFGREFSMLKFRTMSDGAEAMQIEHSRSSERHGPVYKHGADPRITRFGLWLRFTSLDELPQLWNILKGDMSIVGPRPLKMEEMRYSPQWRDLRLSVKPGLTGPWQLNARGGRDFESWIHYDTEYALAPGSLSRDLEILAKTCWKWITGRLWGE